MMFLHLRIRLHQDEHDPETQIIRKCLGTASASAGPRVLFSQAAEFVREIEVQQAICQMREPVQGCSLFEIGATDLMLGRLGGSPNPSGISSPLRALVSQ